MTGGKVPDAWDDDWVEKADVGICLSSPISNTYKNHFQGRTTATEPAAKPAKISKAERRAKQAEFNRQLWEDAEAQNQNYFLNTRTEVPLKSEFKPAMKVLSRKPATKTMATADPALGLEKLALEDDEDDEEDEEKTRTPTAEERQIKAQKEREEKQKKYEEARQRLFGANS
ncbi:MAG: hypothetical protein Q9183_006024, partial [Haloplaca sp. 2 TL-2023]